MSKIGFKKEKPNFYCGYQDNKIVAYANYNVRGNYIDTLWVKSDLRRQGIGTALVKFIIESNKRKLFRCPDYQKTDAVRALGKKFGNAIGPEAKVKQR